MPRRVRPVVQGKHMPCVSASWKGDWLHPDLALPRHCYPGITGNHTTVSRIIPSHPMEDGVNMARQRRAPLHGVFGFGRIVHAVHPDYLSSRHRDYCVQIQWCDCGHCLDMFGVCPTYPGLGNYHAEGVKFDLTRSYARRNMCDGQARDFRSRCRLHYHNLMYRYFPQVQREGEMTRSPLVSQTARTRVRARS